MWKAILNTRIRQCYVWDSFILFQRARQFLLFTNSKSRYNSWAKRRQLYQYSKLPIFSMLFHFLGPVFIYLIKLLREVIIFLCYLFENCALTVNGWCWFCKSVSKIGQLCTATTALGVARFFFVIRAVVYV